MKLETALDEYGLQIRRRRRGDAAAGTAEALAALREYLVDYLELEETTELRPGDLFRFLFEWYPTEEEPDPDVALRLHEIANGFVLWLLDRGERQTAPFAAEEDRLKEDLPRVAHAYRILSEFARRDDIATTLALVDEEESAEVGAAGTGLSRLARLDEIDYASAESDYFQVQTVAGGEVTLQTPGRAALSEPPLGPVRLPPGSAELLRPGDIIHAEIAPGTEGWELLDASSVRPGGYR